MKRLLRKVQASRQLTSSAFHSAWMLSLMIFTGGGCGPSTLNTPLAASEGFKAMIVGVETAPELSPTSSSPNNTLSKIASIYRIVSVKFIPNPQEKLAVARVILESNAGTEVVDLAGQIREGGFVTLVDQNPIGPNQYRLAGDAFCADGDECKQVILDLHYKVGTREVKRQFVSGSLLVSDADADAESDTETATENSSARDSEYDTEIQEGHPEDSESHDHKHEDTDSNTPSDESVLDEEDEFTGQNQMGEFVGAPRSEEILKYLWERPQTPTPGDLPKAPSTTDSSNKKPSTSVRPQPQTPVKPPQGGTQAKPPKSNSQLPVPPAAGSTVEELEKQLAPLVDLRGGGRATGFHNTTKGIRGKLINASQLALASDYHQQTKSGRQAPYGTGMMISLLHNVTQYITKTFYPNSIILVGQISRKNGGPFGSHRSHQNGLDADLPYLGLKETQSALDRRGRIIAGFDFQKTWRALQIIHSQKMIRDNKQVTIVSRYFMSHGVRAGFCSWAKKNDLLKDPLNADIMRRIRSERSHHKHFHLRLRCSPHYHGCQDQAEPPATVGC